MLKKLEQAELRWRGSNTLIDHWLNNRRKLLINYCKIAGLPPYEAENTLPETKTIKTFCDLLMDYVSEGHFEVYDQVVTACEKHGPSSKQLAQQLVPMINETTDAALDFNDKYTATENEAIMIQLDEDLSALGRAMETRFELEDKLLHALHTNHS